MKKSGHITTSRELDVLDFCFPWSRIVSFFGIMLIYSTIVGYLGFFNFISLLIACIVFLVIFNPFSKIVSLAKLLFQNIDLIKFVIILASIGWFTLLLIYFSYPYFSGRDEGSYANAAIELASNKSMFFKPDIISILSSEGPAHQALNFPGFVLQEGKLVSQFSPAYFVYLAIFYLFTSGTIFWPVANGFLILGGMVAFYYILRYFLPRYIALSGLLVLMSNFLFLWFPRFTFSENLAFFLFWNLVFFLMVFYFTKDAFIRKNLFLPIFLIALLFPLTRPEGWWVLFVTILLAFSLRKEIIDLFPSKKWLSMIPIFMIGGLTIGYVFYLEAPVYKRLFKDWLKWPQSGEFYQKLISGQISWGSIKGAIFSIFPPTEKLLYFFKVEWNYGVLAFGIVAFVGFLLFILGIKSKKCFFQKKERIIVKILFLLSAPLFFAFVSPQISSDHPWMLRRFFFGVLPTGIAIGVIMVHRLSKLISGHNFYIAPILLVLMFLPSFVPSAYFVSIKTNTGREEALNKLGNAFRKEDFVFLHRESSGDGWQMFSGPLMSIYGLNAAYIYLPQNITDNKAVIRERWYQGKRSYVVLPPGAYDFEHQIKKEFNLSLDKEISFSNNELEISKNLSNPDFPLLVKNEYSVFVYMMSPK